jgi:hypothetical protein
MLLRRLAAAAFLTALTVLTRLTVLTAERIDLIELIDLVDGGGPNQVNTVPTTARVRHRRKIV